MKNHRCLIAFALTAALLVTGAASAGASPAAGQQQTEKFSKTVPLARGGMLDLGNISGDITVTAGSGDQVVIDATKRSRNGSDLKVVTIDVSVTANRVEVRTRYPEHTRNISVSVDYTVTVPRWAGVTIKSISGDVKVTGTDGELNANTISGSVHVGSAADVRTAKTVSGDVTAENVNSSGTCTFKSISGDLTLRSVKARELQAETISGTAKLDDVTTDRATAKSISGNLSYTGPFAKGGRYEFGSHSGNVSIYTSDKVGFELAASSFSGSIRSDLPLTTRGDTDRGSGMRFGHRLQGTFGDGSATLQLNSFSGDIRIIKK